MNNSTKKLKVLTLVYTINDFPDEILCHLLSFLNSREAVATSILSKRWQFLWTYVNTLELDIKETPGSKLKFDQFVNRALHLHRGLIKRMHLWCNRRSFINDDYANWFQTAISKKVQTLHLRFGEGSHNWPLRLFHSQTLVELNLDYVNIMITSNIPAAPFFPKLKKLRLYRPYSSYESINRFVSGCSILEYFSLTCDDRDGREACYISSATLKEVRYRNPVTPKLKVLYRVVLNTPVLEILKFRKTRISELVVESSMPSLRKAEINSNADSSLKCLEVLSNVSMLSCRVLEPFNPRMIKPNLHAHFDNLTQLVIMGHRFALALLRIFLEKCNNLKDIIFIKWLTYAQRGLETSGVIWEEPEHVPECLLSSLQSVIIYQYPKEEGTIDSMIKYILGNAKVLKLLQIRNYPFMDKVLRRHTRILKKISMFPKASETCKIIVN